jgi:hypothetical protein
MLGMLLVAGVFALGRMPHIDPDVWWHIKVGETILATHRLPTVDVYSFTAPGEPWIAYSWLGDVLLAAAYSVGGLQGILGLALALGSAIVVSLYVYCTLRCGNSKAAFVAMLPLLLLAEVSFTLRPQMVAYLLLILTLIILELFRNGRPRVLWLLPLLFLFWVNFHSSFTIGLGVLAVYWGSGLVEFNAAGLEARRWTSDQRLRLESVFAACLLAVTITPYGTRLAFYPFDYAVSLPLGVAAVQEWGPMPFDTLFAKVFLILLLGFVAAQGALRVSWRLGEFALFLIATYLTCVHMRFLLIFVPFFAPLFATVLSRWVPLYEQTRDRYALNAALMALVLTGLVAFFPSRARLEGSAAGSYPLEAVEYIRRHTIPGPMYNTYGFGGYLLWALGPDHRVFIDGRSDLYEPVGVLADYLRISGIQAGGLATIDSYGIKSCLVDRDEPLVRLLVASGDWHQVYIDRTAIIFVRTRAPSRIAQSVP